MLHIGLFSEIYFLESISFVSDPLKFSLFLHVFKTVVTRFDSNFRDADVL